MITDLKPGDKLVSFFVLRKKELKSKRDSDDDYLSLELGDASGRVTATVWDDVQKHYDALSKGDIVKVKGKAINFRERLHITVEKIRGAEEKDQCDLKQLVPVVDKDRNKLLAHLDELIKKVENDPLKKLLNSIFKDESIRKAFRNAPGGKLWHHNYVGGLLEHTLSVTDISLSVGANYPGINRDLLIAGGLLHDIGKIESYSYKTLIDYTDRGRLLGHIVIGAQIVSDKIKSIPDFPKNLENQLLHLILSHQGKLEQASPVVPMTLEGLLLYY
ncbi:HD domain-containing protein, partial [candidate division KSB1 bacterium]|nr:HD domain-containing protein [candidate division KSB1 bacterium]NIR71463.1 HD domain-containing protein [candidate division KSB1 bacterium]NIS23384.1 HD domain-containing protein [candidate division KSB1 bacterium]NIT70275.1 HD domain-containing protein [candidate division KSB1 bacterium]NIU23998.1 HD domain-containing protein [candidate division KSB1 bacterium]